ncbi:MAG: NAD(P)/FAD-dependent oxidoreductase [Silvanigrellales bacterium]|jgi:NADH dehydrogenase|nr:NAD(P)/FAD-dependent oxidoreductase [Silvanigrellales bacterium]
MKRIVVVGAGFAGLSVAKGLLARRDLHLTVIDEKNHHLFQPLLYQVAMAGLSPADIAVPIRSLLKPRADGARVDVLMGKVTGVDTSQKRVRWTGGDDIGFDFLVVACGATHSYFGHEAWEEHAPGLKTLEQATEIRRRVLSAFEAAEREHDPEKQRELLTFVVVGGGPTGVELAGALGEISRYTLSADFSNIDPRRTRIVLIEAGGRILPSFTSSLSRKAARDLESLGVTVWTSTRVTDIQPAGVSLGREFLRAKTVLWAAGVKPSPLGAALGVPLDPAGRVIVTGQMNLEAHPEIFCLGDQAHVEGPQGFPLPGLAPVAMQQGRYVADAIARVLDGKEAPSGFRYADKGQMATIGRRRAVAETGTLRLGGFVAWLAWIFVHIYYLVGFKNKTFVLLQWASGYLFYRRGARLIVNKEWRGQTAPSATPPSTPSAAERA